MYVNDMPSHLSCMLYLSEPVDDDFHSSFVKISKTIYSQMCTVTDIATFAFCSCADAISQTLQASRTEAQIADSTSDIARVIQRAGCSCSWWWTLDNWQCA